MGSSARRKETSAKLCLCRVRRHLRSTGLDESIAQRFLTLEIDSHRRHRDNQGWDHPKVDVPHLVGSYLVGSGTRNGEPQIETPDGLDPTRDAGRSSINDDSSHIRKEWHVCSYSMWVVAWGVWVLVPRLGSGDHQGLVDSLVGSRPELILEGRKSSVSRCFLSSQTCSAHWRRCFLVPSWPLSLQASMYRLATVSL